MISSRAAFLALATAALTATAAIAAPPQRLLSIVTTGDTEAQAMSLILANEARAAGHEVSMLLCSAAGDIARRDVPQAATKVVTPKGMSVKMLLTGFMKQGGKVSVCAIYLPNRGLKPDALVEGIGVESPTAAAAQMADPAVKVIGH